MTATLFSLPRSMIFTSNGVPDVGATATFYLTGTLTKTAIYSDGALTTQLPNPVTANGAGELPTIYLDPTKTYRLVVKNSAGVTINDIDPYNTVGSLSYSFQELSGVTISPDVTTITTTGWRTGSTAGAARYIYSATVNSAFASAHPTWAVVTANGRGFRLAENQQVNIDMFGSYADFDWMKYVLRVYQGGTTPYVLGVDFHDDYPAWTGAKDWLEYSKRQLQWNAYYKSSPALYFSRTEYYMSDALDLTDGMYQLRGAGGVTADGGAGSALFFAANKCGLLCQSWDTAGVTGTTTNSPKGSAGSHIQDLQFYSLGGTLGQEQHGCLMKAPVTLTRCTFSDFAGDGIIVAADVTHGGNANCFRVYDCMVIRNGRNGFSTVGGDANAGYITGLTANYNAIFGIYETSFLGNEYKGYHTSGNGRPNGSGPYWQRSTLPAGCLYGGLRYQAIPGQEVWCSTHAPTGTKVDNQGWARVIDPGYSASVYPNWVTGMTWRASGAVYTSGAGNKSTLSGYMEQDQFIGWMDSQWTLATGGLQGFNKGAQFTADLGMFRADPGILSMAARRLTDGYVTGVQLGGNADQGYVLCHYWDLENGAPVAHRMVTDTRDYWWQYDTDAATLSYGWSGYRTQKTFGRSSAQPHKLFAPEIMLGAASSERSITFAAAAPTTGNHARGEIVFNTAPSAAGKIGWVCTTAGSPGTWKLWGVIDA